MSADCPLPAADCLLPTAPASGVCRVPGCTSDAKSLGLCGTHYTAMHRGESIGLWRQNRNWAEWETEFLFDHLSALGYSRAAAALGRTRDGIIVRCKRLGVSLLGVDGFYTPTKIERLCGLPGKTVADWIARGLVARKAGAVTGRWRGRVRLVDPLYLRRWLSAHPEAFDWTKLDKFTRARLNLHDEVREQGGKGGASYRTMPARPRCKLVACGHCGLVNRLPLDALGGTPCHGCGRMLSRWATDGYSDEPPMAYRTPQALREAVPYYDEATDRMKCLDCGRWFKAITASHIRRHGHASIGAYFTAHGLPANSPVASRETGNEVRMNWGKTRGAWRNHGTRGPCPTWTDAQLALLREHYPTGDLEQLRNLLGRDSSVSQIRKTAQSLGIKRRVRAKRKSVNVNGEGGTNA